MTELITSHAYQRGPYGRCGHGSPPCNKRKVAHGEPEVVMVPYLAEPTTFADRATPGIAIDDPAEMAPAGLSLIFRLKRHLGEHGEEFTVPWPYGWPLPRIGEVVTAGETGRVRGITFDLDRERIILDCD